MDFKVSIKCEKCKCVFELRPNGILRGGHALSCSDCAKRYSKEIPGKNESLTAFASGKENAFFPLSFNRILRSDLCVTRERSF